MRKDFKKTTKIVLFGDKTQKQILCYKKIKN
jgi:hypothetical protein